MSRCWETTKFLVQGTKVGRALKSPPTPFRPADGFESSYDPTAGQYLAGRSKGTRRRGAGREATQSQQKANKSPEKQVIELVPPYLE